jgi:hypothetical protein
VCPHVRFPGVVCRSWEPFDLDDRRREFLALLPYEDCHTKHEDCLSVLSPENNSGSWLLNREEFLDWVYKPPDGILWVHGKRE